MRAHRGFGPSSLLAVVLVLAFGSTAFAQSFIDDFAGDSTASYTLTLIEPTRGTGTFVYDAAGQRGQILNGNDFGLRVAHSIPSRSSGRFSVDLRPTVKYPSGGILTLRLIQDASNYYMVTNTDGYVPGSLSKVVGGLVVETASFGSGYVQNVDYTVLIDFGPDHVSVQAFGQTLALSQDATPLDITSFEIESFQQDVYIDTILYGDEATTNHAPVANAGSDQAAPGGEFVTLDASASTDPDGSIVSYFWEQLSGPSVALSNPASATPTFVAPNSGMGSTALLFRVTVADVYGATSSDEVQVDAWAQASLGFSDDFASDSSGSYELTLIEPTRGTGTFVYDAAGQRGQILNGNDFGLRVARNVPPRSNGRFAVDLLPTMKYPGTARLTLRLVQDANNYYVLTTTASSIPGTFTKVVGGVAVDTVSFTGGYIQNTPYTVTIYFRSDLAVAAAFGQTSTLEQDATRLTITRFEIETFQQDVYFDNVSLVTTVQVPAVPGAGLALLAGAVLASAYRVTRRRAGDPLRGGV